MVLQNDKMKPLSKAPYKDKNIKTIHASFNLSKNELAAKGTKTAIMRIEKPDGSIIYDPSTDGNTFSTIEGSKKYYTVSKKVNYGNNYESIILTYEKNDVLVDGKYNVTIYLDGDEIGKTFFEIK